ncbi:hypothetical protein VUR80DRAFT_8776 [Thermomyces stellatus]
MSSAGATGLMAVARRRLFSLRNMARACEPHPYQRVTMADKAGPAYGKLAKNVASRVVFFGPAISLILAWPLVTRRLLNGHVQ